MKRAIIVPAELPPEALAELKQWLAISGTRDDAALERQLHAALELCEGFIGQMPLEATCEELLGIAPRWQRLATRPVQAIVGVEGVPASAPRFALPAAAYEIELDADGGALVGIDDPGAATRVAVRFVAGLAPSWAELPVSLRDGVIRLAASQHRVREAVTAERTPPAAVTALWRPWRRLRLA